MQEIQADTSFTAPFSNFQGGDSIASVQDSFLAPPVEYSSILNSSAAGSIGEPGLLAGTDQAIWVPFVLIGGFVLFAWARLYYRHRLELIVQGIFAKNFANQLSREGNIFNERIGDL